MDKTPREHLGYLYVIASAAMFGLMPLFTKIAYRYGSDPYTVSFMRFFFTFLVSGIIILCTPQMSFRVTAYEMKWIAVISVIYATIPLTLYGSYTFIDSSLASALHFAYPVVVMLLSVVVLHTKLNTKQVLCAVICMSGVALLTQTSGGGSMLGAVMALASGVSYALYVVLLTKSGLQDMPKITMVFWLSVYTGAYLLVFTVVTGKLNLALPLQAHLAHFLLAACSTMFAIVLFQKGMVIIGGVRATLLSTFEPLVSVLVGIVVFHEALTVRIAAGIALILASAVLLVKE